MPIPYNQGVLVKLDLVIQLGNADGCYNKSPVKITAVYSKHGLENWFSTLDSTHFVMSLGNLI